MVNFFPPKPVYPKSYDNDSTLFLVYNTSETITTENNQPWSEEISIKPVDADRPEVWADNGFANINGELFYYDDVEKDVPIGSGLIIGKIIVDEYGGISSIPVLDGGSGYFYPSIKVNGSGFDAKVEAVVENGSIVSFNIIQSGRGYKPLTTSLTFEGKVYKLKRCSRNIGGSHTKFNPAGSDVRGFVIAEHHNQIADAVINIENFVGYNFDTDKETLDWRIRHLQNLPIIFDDYTCPDVSFSFYTVSEDPATGTTIQYDVVIIGSYNSYSLDFGDGQSTNTSLSGTHVYAASSTIDPIVTVTSSSCTIVQTPVLRTVATEPTVPPTTPGFSINIPVIPDLPPFVFPSIPIPSTPQIPPIVFPCLDVGPIGPINVPSIISIIPPITIPSIVSIVPSINIPSFISITPIPSLISVEIPSIPSIPSLIIVTDPKIPTSISIVAPNMPLFISMISFTIPSIISFTDPKIPSIISFADPPSCIPNIISFTDPKIPSIISFANPPSVEFWISWEDPTQYEWWYTSFWISWEDPMQYEWWYTFTSWMISWEDPTYYSWWYRTFWISWEDPTSYSWWNKSWYVSWVDAPTEYSSWWNKTWWVSWVDAPNQYSSWWNKTWWVSWSEPTPVISVVFPSNMPTLSCIVTVNCGGATSMIGGNYNNIDTDGLTPPESELLELNVGDIGIPSEIKVIFPEQIPDIKVIHDVPAIIRVVSPDIPSEIKIKLEDFIPSEIKIVNENIPTLIEFSVSNIPSSIQLDASNLPKSIPIEVPEQFPSIKLDASMLPDKIQVVGVPSTIELVGAPSEIKLVLPEKPEIELVYKGAPIDVKINLDVGRLTGENEKSQCVAIVPCGNQ